MRTSDTWSAIAGTGSYIPETEVPNSHFMSRRFCDEKGVAFERPIAETIAKFEAITGIKARRYVTDDQQASDIAFFASREALSDWGGDPEDLDYIVVAHNFGDVSAQSRRIDLVPTLAARVKQMLRIKNPRTIAYDLPFGCPGWLQAMIQVDYFLRSGDADKALVVGTETLSRISDPYDRDSMIYADGAGACVVEAVKSAAPVGIIAHAARSDTFTHAQLLRMGPSYSPDFDGDDIFLKMRGHKLYEYALRTVPKLVKDCITKAGLGLEDIKKVLIHQANAKMDEAILKRIYKLFGIDQIPSFVMPMTIEWLGNSSVATIPTLIDLLFKGKLKNHHLQPSHTIAFASVGAGMNVNSMLYTMP